MSAPLRIDGTWDIETEEWDTFVMGGIHTAEGTAIHDSPDRFFECLMALDDGTYWAHNGGRFDTLWLIEMLLKHRIPWTGALRGSSVIEVVVDKKHFRDSYATFPEPLSIVAEAGGAEKISTGLECRCRLACVGYCARQGVACECPTTCGGYCAIRRDMPPRERSRLREYLAADCEGLMLGLRALEAYCARVDIDLRPTIGATAWTTCARWIGLDTKSPAHTKALYHDLRAGYYGGRNEVYGLRSDTGRRRDINSAYVAALSTVALPIGDIRSAYASQAYASGMDGVYTARLTIPECHSPPLPIRTADRLAYCYGEIAGTWTGIELRHAEAMGARIDAIESGIYCEKSEAVLAPFANRAWDLRQRAKKEETDGIYRYMKWYGNSLTGKLAMQPTVVTLACVPEEVGMRIGEEKIMQKHGMLVCAREAERVSSCAHVEWAAHLTTIPRTQVNIQLTSAGDAALYCDTDSVYADCELTAGEGLGQWKDEGDMREWQCLAPKIYRYWDDVKRRYVTRGKGMSRLTPVGFDALAEGKPWVVDEGVNTLKTAIQKKQGIFTRKHLSRKLAKEGDFVGSRRRDGNRTRAVDYRDYALAAG